MAEKPQIKVQMAKTRSGKPWPVFTDVGDLVQVNGYGLIRLWQQWDMQMAPEDARARADELEKAARELRAAADWAEEHEAELNGYER